MTHTADVPHQFKAGDHAAEVVPARDGDLQHVNHEEDDIAHGQPEVEKTRELVAAQQCCEPVQLRRLVDGQAG
jgi:hypothetical protein